MSSTISPALVRSLFRRLKIDISMIQSPQAEGDWTKSLGSVLEKQGFLTTTWCTPLSSVASQVSVGLPILGLTPKGEWLLLENHSWNWIRYYNLSKNKGKWQSVVSLEKDIGRQNIEWLLIEPVQPKSILSSEQKRLNPLQRLWKLVALEQLDIGMIVGLSALLGILGLAVPLTIQVLINWVAFGGLTQPILSLSIMLFVILCLSSGLSIFQRIIIERLERRLFIRTVEDLSRRFHQVKIEVLDGVNVSDYANRFFDILTIQKSTSTLLIEGLGATLQIFVATAVLALYHPWFLAVDGLLLLGMFAIFRMYSKNGTKSAIIESKSKYKVASWIESIGHHSTGFRLGSQQIAPIESERLTSVWLEHRENHFSVFIQQYGSAQIFQITMSILVLLLGGQLVLDGELTIGQFVAAEFVVTNALIGFTKFMDKMDTIYDLLASLDKLGTVLDLDVEPLDGLGKQYKCSSVVEVSNLRLMDMPNSFSHHFEAQTVNFVEVPFSISTYQLAEALIGIRKPVEGYVLHDNVEVQHLCLTERYKGLHLLCNEDIFEGSIYDNITMGDVRIQSIQIWEILEQIGVAEFLERKQDGLDLQMPTANPLLNSGIALARCLLTPHRLIVSVDFFTDLPAHIQMRWLELLSTNGATCIVLEGQRFYSRFPFDSSTKLTTQAVAS